MGVQQRGELVRYDATARQFVPYRKGLSAEMLDYSKDRERVAYITYPEGDLWQSKLDGSARLQLSFAPMQAAVPRWSPDGKRIAFLGRLPGKPWRVYLVSSEGGAPQQLMPEERYENDPSWSPDGNTLAFGTNPETNLPAGSSCLTCGLARSLRCPAPRDSSRLAGRRTDATSLRFRSKCLA